MLHYLRYVPSNNERAHLHSLRHFRPDLTGVTGTTQQLKGRELQKKKKKSRLCHHLLISCFMFSFRSLKALGHSVFSLYGKVFFVAINDDRTDGELFLWRKSWHYKPLCLWRWSDSQCESPLIRVTSGVISTSRAFLHSSKSFEKIFSVYISISSANTQDDHRNGATGFLSEAGPDTLWAHYLRLITRGSWEGLGCKQQRAAKNLAPQRLPSAQVLLTTVKHTQTSIKHTYTSSHYTLTNTTDAALYHKSFRGV